MDTLSLAQKIFYLVFIVAVNIFKSTIVKLIVGNFIILLVGDFMVILDGDLVNLFLLDIVHLGFYFGWILRLSIVNHLGLMHLVNIGLIHLIVFGFLDCGFDFNVGYVGRI